MQGVDIEVEISDSLDIDVEQNLLPDLFPHSIRNSTNTMADGYAMRKTWRQVACLASPCASAVRIMYDMYVCNVGLSQ